MLMAACIASAVKSISDSFEITIPRKSVGVSHLTYRPEIDGLRAFAVVAVILFHMNYQWIPGGFAGVDVFFVISGYLITTRLKKDLESQAFSFRDFWARRIRRILPALILVTATTLFFAQLFGFRADRPEIAKQARAALFSYANFYFWSDAGDYWRPLSEESPFLHTWSLSVEEQFYLVFPVFFFVVYRLRPQWLKGLILAVLISSILLFLYGSRVHRIATFYFLPTRAWELATGGYVALVLQNDTVKRTQPLFPSVLALSGLSMVICSFLCLRTLNAGIVISILGTALVIAFSHIGVCRTLLSHKLVVHIGKISYSLYLWHWPVLVYAKQFGLDVQTLILLIPIYLLSLVSYYFVETPMRRREGNIPLISAAYLITLGLCAFVGYSLPYYDGADFEKQHSYLRYFDMRPRIKRNDRVQTMIATMDVPRRESALDAYRNGGIIIGNEDSTNPRIVVLGDSHGGMWADTIRSITEELEIKTSIITVNAVPPFIKIPLSRTQKSPQLTSEEKYLYDKSRIELLQLWKPDVTILCARWESASEADASAFLDLLEQHSARTLLMEQPPELAVVGNRNALQYLIFRGITPEIGRRQYLPLGNTERVNAGRDLIRKLARTRKSVDIIPIYDLYVENAEAFVLDGRNMIYYDDDHLTTYGAKLGRPRIQQAISEALGIGELKPN